MRETTQLTLPGGVEATLTGDPSDISVFGAIRVQTGTWEPHLMRLFEAVVCSDSICLDVGANIGVHTMALATLARDGQVWAIEATKRNFELLELNVSGLASPHAEVRTLRNMLWDKTPAPAIASVRQVAGCSFTSRAIDRDAAEQYIREQVPAEIFAQEAPDITLEEAEPVTLDEWAEVNEVGRLDLIKMDIEGAETRALAGGQAMLSKLKPALVTEYNPVCSGIYWGAPPDEYYKQLASAYSDIRIVAHRGDPVRVSAWDELKTALDAGPGWVDLCCGGWRVGAKF